MHTSIARKPPTVLVLVFGDQYPTKNIAKETTIKAMEKNSQFSVSWRRTQSRVSEESQSSRPSLLIQK